MPLKNKTALVLGATRGIGRAAALALAGQGSRLVLPYYDWPRDCEQTFAELERMGADHITVKTDLRNPTQVRHLIQLIEERYSALDILINNIERGGMPIVHGPYTPEQWDLEMDTTLKAKWWVFQEALPLMKKSGPGVVVILSSIAGQVGRSGPAGLIFNEGYAAANRAISSLTETWARQAAPEIRVNELMLGFIETRHAQGTRGWDLLSQEERQAIIDRTLLRRTGTLAEVTETLIFLVRQASFMTGSTLCLDGGYLLGHDRVPVMPAPQDGLEIQEVEE